jgi:hypothetical protein
MVSSNLSAQTFDGAALYGQHCAACHGALANSDVSGASASAIQIVIDTNVAGMGSLSSLTAEEVQAIANALSPSAPPPCPATLALEGADYHDGDLRVLYDFRDKVLLKRPAGRWYVRQYYRHAWEGCYLFLRYPELREQSRDVLEQVIPRIEAVVDGESVVLTLEDVAGIEDLMEAIHSKASPKLRKAIREFRSDFRKGNILSLFGISRVEGQL